MNLSNLYQPQFSVHVYLTGKTQGGFFLCEAATRINDILAEVTVLIISSMFGGLKSCNNLQTKLSSHSEFLLSGKLLASCDITLECVCSWDKGKCPVIA